MKLEREKALKQAYIDAKNEALEEGKVQHTGTYTPKMLRALKDMANADVYPDWRFGDEECNVWEMFRFRM